MPLISLLYVSVSTLDPTVAQAAVDEIVATSATNNAMHDITGALLFTGTNFAQVLEGEADHVDRLMGRVCKDRRHRDVLIVDRSAIDARRFHTWNMAYFGPSQFVGRHVARLLNEPSPTEQRRAVAWLTDLMHEFIRT